MKRLAILSLVFLASCGSVHKNKQTQEMTQFKTQNDSVFNSTNSKLSEVLNENKSLKAENISFKNEIENYQSKIKELQEKSLSESSEDLLIENAKGVVKLTDKNGNSYEIGADNGTRILRTTATKLQKELSEKTNEVNNLKTLTEKQKQTIEQLEEKNKNILKRTKTFRKEIKSIEDLLTKLQESSKTDRKNIHLWVYVIIGISIILIWEFSKYAIKSRLKIF
ncbi:hypothetical protein PG614_02285 [Riemerella anatipestifer]|nr:hypothetical protein [Riemerella anatipestifer]MDY3532678.1 hypothetical protein [Riemerella anatipestifer]MDY3534768.1 hypothetical protein [Riemerella anatipestifer]